MRKLIVLLALMATLMGCDNKQRETKLLEKIEQLENQLDECRNGAEKIHSKMKLSYEQKDFKLCKSLYSEMEQRHPDSQLFTEVRSIYDNVDSNNKCNYQY